MSSELCEAICKTLLAIQRYTPSNMGSISPYCIALYSKLQSSSNFRVISYSINYNVREIKTINKFLDKRTVWICFKPMYGIIKRNNATS